MLNKDAINTVRAAKLLRISRNRVSCLCRQFGFPRFGREYVIGPDELDRLRERRTKAGRPRK